MTRITYVLQFRRALKSPENPEPVAVASSLALRTVLDAAGVQADMEVIAGQTATMENQFALSKDQMQFFEWGTIDFGGSSLTFRSVGAGSLLGPPASDGFSQGVVSWQIEQGTGFFQGATGAITSNFLVDLKTEELIDTQCHVIALP